MQENSDIIPTRIHLPAGGTLRLVALLFILVLLGFVAYWDPLRQLSASVLEREGSSHGVFVPFISVYLLWLNWDEIKAANYHRPARIWALTFLCAGALLFMAAQNQGGFRLASLSFFLTTAGLVILLFGRELFRYAGFPILLLITMIPLTDTAHDHASDVMRTMTTWGSVGLLKLAGVPHYREGFDLYLKNSHLYVAHSCSGVRYLLSYLVFGTAYAFRFKETLPARIATIAAAIPMAIIGGILRLSVIFFTVHYIGPYFAEHKPHVILSWSVFTGMLVFTIALDRILSQRSKKVV